MHHDKRVRIERTFAPRYHAFIKQPPLATSPAARFALEGYTKILARQVGPYCIISVGLEYVKGLQDGIKNLVFISRGTRVPRPRNNDNDGIASEGSRVNNDHQLPEEGERRVKEYTVKKIIGQKGPKTENVTTFDGMDTTSPMIRMTLRNTFRHT